MRANNGRSSGGGDIEPVPELVQRPTPAKATELSALDDPVIPKPKIRTIENHVL